MSLQTMIVNSGSIVTRILNNQVFRWMLEISGLVDAFSGSPVYTLGSVAGDSNSLVSTVPPTSTATAIVAGYYEANDGGAAPVYIWHSTYAGSTNEGTIIRPDEALVGAWFANFSGEINAKWFGCKQDCQNVDGVDIQAAATTFDAAGFVEADIGKVVSIAGAGVAGDVYTSTISNVVGTTITVAAAFDTTVNPATVYWGSDDTIPLQNALALAFSLAVPGQGSSVYIPSGQGTGDYFTDTLSPEYSVSMRGDGIRKTTLRSIFGGDVVQPAANWGQAEISCMSLRGLGTSGNSGKGLYVISDGPGGSGTSAAFRVVQVEMSLCGSNGYAENNVFNRYLQGLDVGDCGDHLYLLRGGNTCEQVACFVRNPQPGKAGIRKTSTGVLRGFSGLAQSYDGGLNGSDLGIWGLFGPESGSGAIGITLDNCNVEDATITGISILNAGFFDLVNGTQIAMGSATNMVAVQYDEPAGRFIGRIEGGVNITKKGGTWKDDAPIHNAKNNHLPFFQTNNVLVSSGGASVGWNDTGGNAINATYLGELNYGGNQVFDLPRVQMDQFFLDRNDGSTALGLYAASNNAIAFGSINPGAFEDKTINVPGAATGRCFGWCQPNTDPGAGFIFTAFVSGANTVTIRMTNVGAAPATPTNGNWNAGAIRFA